MSRLLEWFDATPLIQKVACFGLLFVLFGSGFYWIVVEPLIDQTEKLKVELQDLDGKLRIYLQSEERFRKASEDLSNWESLVSRQEERLGLEVPMSQVFSDMSSMAQDTGILFTLWKPDLPNPESLEGRQQRHLQIHVEGGYHAMARFLDQTQYLSKSMGVTAFKMHRVGTGDGTPRIRATFEFVGYEGRAQTITNPQNVRPI